MKKFRKLWHHCGDIDNASVAKCAAEDGERPTEYLAFQYEWRVPLLTGSTNALACCKQASVLVTAARARGPVGQCHACTQRKGDARVGQPNISKRSSHVSTVLGIRRASS